MTHEVCKPWGRCIWTQEDASRLILFVITDFPCYTSTDLAWTPTVVARTRRILAAIYRDWPAEGGGKERTFDSASSRKGETRERNCTIGSRKIICRVPAEPTVGAPRVRVAVHHVASGKFVRYLLGVTKCCLFTTRAACYCVSRRKSWLCLLTPLVTAPYTDLYMQVTDESVLLLEDSEVTFKGYGSEQRYMPGIDRHVALMERILFTSEIFSKDPWPTIGLYWTFSFSFFFSGNPKTCTTVFNCISQVRLLLLPNVRWWVLG